MKPTFFGDIIPSKNELKTGVQRIFADEGKVHRSDGNVAVCFEAIPSDSTAITLGQSYVGTDSNYLKPSMIINFSDPPLDDFTWNGRVYNYTAFANENRYGCGPLGCPENFEGGTTILHEVMHALGAHHEHLNTDQRPYTFDEAKVYQSLCPGSDPSDKRDPCIISVDVNYLGKIGCEGCVPASQFDPYSIMTYQIPQEYLASGTSPDRKNLDLSDTDKTWLSTTYPLDNPNPPTIQVVFGNGHDWQKAWFEKTVMEKIKPYAGVNFEFQNSKEPFNCQLNTAPASMPIQKILLMAGIILGSIVGL